MFKTLRIVVAAIGITFCGLVSAESTVAQGEVYTCPHCGARLVKVGDKLVEVTPTAQPANNGAATAAPAAPTPAATPATPAPQVVVVQAPAAGAKIYPVAAKEMIGIVEQAVTQTPLNLKVESSQSGVIETSYKEGYPGNFHIARRWQERTKFRIVVIPDVNNPTGACRLDVTPITQERSNDRASWQDRTDTQRPERAEEVVKAVEAKLK